MFNYTTFVLHWSNLRTRQRLPLSLYKYEIDHVPGLDSITLFLTSLTLTYMCWIESLIFIVDSHSDRGQYFGPVSSAVAVRAIINEVTASSSMKIETGINIYIDGDMVW